MLSKQAKARIAHNKRVRRHLWDCRKRYGINRARWPSPWTIAYNSVVERDPIVFGEAFFPSLKIEPDDFETFLSDQRVATVGISPELITAGPQFSTAEVMSRHYGFKKNAT